MGLKLKKFNAVNDNLPQDLDSNLQAFAQETGQISYTDIMKFKGDAEEYKKLRYHLNKWNEYIESGQDEKALKKSDDIRAMIKGQKDFGLEKKAWHVFALDIEGGSEVEVGAGDYSTKEEAEVAWNEIANKADQKYSNPKFKCYSKKHRINLRRFSSSEIAAVVLKNSDGTHEVVSIQNESDEDRVKSYVEDEGATVVKRCKNTKEADEYINSKKLTRAYSHKSGVSTDPQQSFTEFEKLVSGNGVDKDHWKSWFKKNKLSKKEDLDKLIDGWKELANSESGLIGYDRRTPYKSWTEFLNEPYHDYDESGEFVELSNRVLLNKVRRWVEGDWINW